METSLTTLQATLQAERRLLWAAPAYGAIFIGMYVLPSAWVAMFGFHLALVLALRPRLRTLPTRWLAPVSPPLLLAMIVVGFVGGTGLWLIWPYVGVAAYYRAHLIALGLSDGFAWAFFIVYFSLVNPWLEEAFWRDELTHPTRGLALVDMLYAGFHLLMLAPFVGPFWLLVVFVILTATGWLWRNVARLSGSLFPCVVCHILADLSIVWVLYQKWL